MFNRIRCWRPKSYQVVRALTILVVLNILGLFTVPKMVGASWLLVFVVFILAVGAIFIRILAISFYLIARDALKSFAKAFKKPT